MAATPTILTKETLGHALEQQRLQHRARRIELATLALKASPTPARPQTEHQHRCCERSTDSSSSSQRSSSAHRAPCHPWEAERSQQLVEALAAAYRLGSAASALSRLLGASRSDRRSPQLLLTIQLGSGLRSERTLPSRAQRQRVADRAPLFLPWEASAWSGAGAPFAGIVGVDWFGGLHRASRARLVR